MPKPYRPRARWADADHAGHGRALWRVGRPSDARRSKLTDPRTNIRAGTRYLRDLINHVPGAAGAGAGRLQRGRGRGAARGQPHPQLSETQNYVKTVMQLYTMLKPPEALAERRAPTRPAATAPEGSAPARGLPAMQAAGLAPAGAPVGGAMGRGNMIAPLVGARPAPEFKIERD
jgi:hypothetical protein